MSLKKDLLKEIKIANEINQRLKSFDIDIKHWKDYDYIIINKNLEICFKQDRKHNSI